MPPVFRPAALVDALTYLTRLAGTQSPVLAIAGATDVLPAHVGRSLTDNILDLSGLAALRGLSVGQVDGRAALRIGALSTWTDIADWVVRDASSPAFDALALAAREIGGAQIQHRGTIGGNLCHASPAADGVPVLLALNASVVLTALSGSRTLALADFLTGPRSTTRRQDELLEAVVIPMPQAHRSQSVFLKLGHRRYLVISAVMVAAAIDWIDDPGSTRAGKPGRMRRVAQCRIAVGACGPVASRLPGLEQTLAGLDAPDLDRLCEAPGLLDESAPLRPIDDLRGTREYRLKAADVLVRRALRLMARDAIEAGTP